MTDLPGTEGAWSGGSVTSRAWCVLEDNPGHMTLDGTNTWVLREPGAERSLVVDPGEHDEPHLRAVLEAASPVGLVVLTHRHGDHADGARRFAELSGSPVRAADRSLCVDGDPLRDGERLAVDGLAVRILATPGHTTDSVSVALESEPSLLSGDTILGRGTSVVAHPDGVLGDYLRSLRSLRDAVTSYGEPVRLLPGHGPDRPDAGAVIDAYLAHRAERLDQVRAAMAGGAVTAREVVERVYAEVDPVLWPAAEQSVAAQLDYLTGE